MSAATTSSSPISDCDTIAIVSYRLCNERTPAHEQSFQTMISCGAEALRVFDLCRKTAAAEKMTAGARSAGPSKTDDDNKNKESK